MNKSQEYVEDNRRNRFDADKPYESNSTSQGRAGKSFAGKQKNYRLKKKSIISRPAIEILRGKTRPSQRGAIFPPKRSSSLQMPRVSYVDR